MPKSYILIYIYTYKIVNYKVPNGELTNGIRYINKESLFRVINPSASVNKGITEPISLTQGRCKNPWFTEGYRRVISVKR